MSKARKRKKKPVKGVRYIASVLQKYFGKKYPKYSIALPKARELQAYFAANKKKVGVTAIFEKVRRKQTGASKVPVLPLELVSPSYYFDLIDYPTYIARCDNRIWFKSKLWSKKLPDIQGGSAVEYQDYFAPFVNFINGQAGAANKEDKRYEHDWMVMCTPPVLNKNKKRWESEVVSVDSNGERVNYGFDPEKPSKSSGIVTSEGVGTKEKAKAPEIKEKEVISGSVESVELVKERVRLAEAETARLSAEANMLKQSNIGKLLDLFNSGVLSKAELKEALGKM